MFPSVLPVGQMPSGCRRSKAPLASRIGVTWSCSRLEHFLLFLLHSGDVQPGRRSREPKEIWWYIPGIRPGAKTAEYIDYVLTRLTCVGALYVAAVCLVPMFVMQYFSVSFYFGGTSLLIIVSVALDTVQQIESHLIARDYEGFTVESVRVVSVRATQPNGVFENKPISGWAPMK